MAKLFFKYGAMNAGKSTLLMQAAHNYEERGMSVLLIKPSVDTKGGNKLTSRLGIERKVDIKLGREESVQERLDTFLANPNCFMQRKLACVFVDEAQFLTREQVDELFNITTVMDIPVICYGLRADFLLNGFEGSTRLLELAHNIEEIKTICACGKKALINARKVNGRFVFKGKQVAIDGEEVEYESLCPKCYLKYKQNFGDLS